MDNNLPVNAEACVRFPGPGRSLKATDQLSPCATAAESNAAATEAHAPWSLALQQERPHAMQYLCLTREAPHAACSQCKPEHGSEDPTQPKID